MTVSAGRESILFVSGKRLGAKKEYDDSLWDEGKGAFGPVKGNYPAHTLWGAENIYVRRHIRVDDKDLLKEHKVYVRYICDDQIKLFVMEDIC